MEKITHDEFRARLSAQGMEREHSAFICPMCGTGQSMALLRGAGVPEDKLDTQIGFSCVGRWNNAGPATREGKPANTDKPGCDWTLGGLFRLHQLEVEHAGKSHPMFVIASKEQAEALRAQVSE